MYRNVLAALRVRIAEAEEVLISLTDQRDQRDGARNLGPRASGGFQRALYRAGRGLGRALRRLRRQDEQDVQSAVEAARARLDVLEERIARLRRELDREP